MTDTQIENLQVSKIQATEAHVQHLLEQKIPKEMAKMKEKSTRKMLKAAQRLADEVELPADDRYILELAVVFTNAGYSESLHNPYFHSSKVAKAYMSAEKFAEKTIERVSQCLNTNLPEAKPRDLTEEVYQDVRASLYADKKYVKKTLPKIQAEEQIEARNPIKSAEWLREHRAELKEIEFNTEPAQELYEKRLKKNLKKIKKLRKKKEKGISKYEAPIDKSKSAQVILKTALRNHIDLTNIADGKSNIMLSINAIIITIAAPLLTRYIADNGYLIIPMTVLIITCVTSIIFAALATRPIKMDGETNIDKVMDRPGSNLFFFGNFFNVPLLDYQRGMKQVLRDTEVLERSIINDLYFLGLALGKKFNLLRVCYLVFMVGIACSVLAYALTLYFTELN